MERQIMIELQESGYSDVNTFFPLHKDARYLQVPEQVCFLTRERDGYKLMFEGYTDRLVCAHKERACVLIFENQVTFNFSIPDRRIWFTKRQNGETELFIAQTETALKNLIKFLKTRCPQQDFYLRYQLQHKISQGRNSSVWTAIRKFDRKIFAVKIQRYVQERRLEIDVLRVLQHPNVIHLKEYFIDREHQTYIVTDYEDGGSLFDVIRLGHKLDSQKKIKIITDMLNALQYLRLKGIVHRDLKPQNILYSTKDGNYKIADFGISKRVGQKLDKISGTPGYIAPQLFQYNGQCVADIKSDIYSMGLIFYQILTLKQYYPGNSIEETIKKNSQKISLKKKQTTKLGINQMQFGLLYKMIRSHPYHRKTSYEILTSQLFGKIHKMYGLHYVGNSNKNSSKKSFSGEDENQDDNFVDSIWKIIKIRKKSS